MTRNLWWQDACIYQIYPRSFCDSNGDGIGDLPGIISKLDEIAALGVDAIWLSPVYVSPDADNGYDIADYKNIDPRYGTLTDFDKLVAECKARGIRIIMDLVINHTSSEHEWFRKSRMGDPEYKDYYIWQAGKGDKPPNNWTGFFMGSVWEWDEMRGEYYLHLFDKGQPDLNYRNPAVIKEIEGILEFWLERGAGGFRCDVINVLWKESLADGKPALVIRGMEHYKTAEGLHPLLRRLRDTLDKYDAFTVGETVMADVSDAKALTDVSRHELDTVFYFDHLEVDRVLFRYIKKKFRASELLRRLSNWQRVLDNNAVALENHDQPRIVSHYGDDGEYRERSAKLLAVLLLTQKGTTFIYQGQELGMTNYPFKDISEYDDVETRNINELAKKLGIPTFIRNRIIAAASRDNARTPYQWDSSANAGFTIGTPWLAVNPNYESINYAEQNAEQDSVLAFYREMIALRKSSETLHSGDFVPGFTDDRLLSYTRLSQDGRSSLQVILNFSSSRASFKMRRYGNEKILISNTGRSVLTDTLAPWEALVIERCKGTEE